LIVLIGLLIGLIAGLFLDVTIPSGLTPYLAVLTLVGIEALTATYNAMQRKEFAPAKFVIELLSNLVISGLLTALGVQLKYDFAFVIAFVFAYRIFRNISFISRNSYLKFKAWRASRQKDEVAEEQ
jgi:small basic protein